MIRLNTATCILVLLLLCSCHSGPETKNPVQLRRRSEMLLTEASTLSKKARGCEVIIERAEKGIERHKNRLKILREKIDEQRERIGQVAEKQASLSKSKAEELNITIDRYRRQIKSLEAGVSAEKSTIRALRKDIKNHKKLLGTYRRRERKRRSEANRLQNLAERYSDRK